MSTSLVRKSLEIIGYDDDTNQGKKKKKSNKSKQGILGLIPSNQRIDAISRKGKKESKIVVIGSSKKKRTIGEAKKQLKSKTDQTEKNIERLLLLSSNHLDYETSEKLLNRAVNKRYAPKAPERVEDQQTAFTEADFEQFEKEYHVE